MPACFHEKLPVLEKQSDDGFCSREGRGKREEGDKKVPKYRRYMYILDILYLRRYIHVYGIN